MIIAKKSPIMVLTMGASILLTVGNDLGNDPATTQQAHGNLLIDWIVLRDEDLEVLPRGRSLPDRSRQQGCSRLRRWWQGDREPESATGRVLGICVPNLTLHFLDKFAADSES